MNRTILWLVFALSISACMDYGAVEEENFSSSQSGLFIINEGNFMYGNASLSYYDTKQKSIENEVFVRANGAKLGDVAQSMNIYNNLGYIVVNNSGIIYVINLETFQIVNTIKGLNSPRYIHFIDDQKAYVTDLYDSRITIINPSSQQITGYIPMGNHQSTEQMVQYDKYVFTNCWSYDNKILVIDTETDALIDSITVGIQPTSLVIDCNNQLWTVTDGGYEGSPYGYTTPALYRIDAPSRSIKQIFSFKMGDAPSEICLNGTRDTLYFINDDIWQMPVNATHFPTTPIVESQGTLYYGLAVDPRNSDIYVADAIDYVQPGYVYRYSSVGNLLDQFKVGIIPGAFRFKP